MWSPTSPRRRSSAAVASAMPTGSPVPAMSACPRTSAATSTFGRPRATTSPSPPGLRPWRSSRRRS
eukprot:10094634-Alexandrium_andersonii.AAC.1